jgi:hypothetical protein
MLGQAHLRTGHFDRALELLREAETLAPNEEEKARIAAAAAWTCWQNGKNHECSQHGWRGLAFLGDKRPRSRPGAILAILGELLRFWAAAFGLGKAPPPNSRDTLRCRAYHGMHSGLLMATPLLGVLALFRMVRLARSSADPALAAVSTSRALGGISWSGLWPLARVLWKRSQQILQTASDPWALGTALVAEHAFYRWPDGYWRDRRLHLQRAEEYLRQAGDYATATGSSSFLSIHRTWLGEIKEVVSGISARLMQLARLRKGRQDERQLRATQIDCLARAGDRERALAEAEAVAASARAEGDLFSLILCLAMGGDARRMNGEIEGAIAALEECWVTMGKAMSTIFSLPVFLFLPRLLLRSDRDRAARRRRASNFIRQGRKLVRKRRKDLEPAVLFSQAVWFDVKGDRPKSDQLFERATAAAKEQGLETVLTEILLERAQVAHRLGLAPQAADLAHEAKTIAEKNGDVWMTGQCEKLLAASTCEPMRMMR